jgi:hypothetical protein
MPSNRVMMLGLKVILQLSRTNFMVFGARKVDLPQPIRAKKSLLDPRFLLAVNLPAKALKRALLNINVHLLRL